MMATHDGTASARSGDPGLVSLADSALTSAAFSALTQGVVVHAQDGRILQVNPAAEQILGLSAEQMSGRTPLDPAWHAVHEDGSPFPGETHPASLALATGAEQRDVTMGVHKPDGTLTWIWVNAVPVGQGGGGSGAGVVATFTDITEQRRLRAEVDESEQRYRLLAENSTDVVVRAKDGIITFVSPSLLSTLLWWPEEWVGRPSSQFVHPDDADQQATDYADPAHGVAGTARRRLLDAGGSYHWVETHYQPFIDSAGQPDGYIAAFRIIDDVVEVELELERRARYDDLTGLLNRAEIIDRLNAILIHPRRVGREIAVAFCDIDDFHQINETYGHAGGDEALRCLAERFASVVRDDDLVARFGGDEILVVLPGVHGLDQAIGVADKLRRQALAPIPADEQAISVSLSIGVTLAHRDESADSLIARADDAMFAAKAGGKDRVVAIPDPES
jgi:diguanylate cyclase (GGDEF)-like protein/PAS domain S-box-containing protein